MTVTQNDIIQIYIDAVKNHSLTVSDVLTAASTKLIESVDNLYRTNVTPESRLISSIDSFDLTEGDRILIKDQSDSKQNGVYETIFSSAVPGKLTVQKVDQELTNSIAYVIKNGKTNANTIWVTKITQDHPDNFNFIPISSFSDNDNTLPSSIQQTIFTPEPLTIFNSNFAVSNDIYISGITHAKTLVADNLSINDKFHISNENESVFVKSEQNPISFSVGTSVLPSLSIHEKDVSITNDFQCLGKSRFLGDVSVSGDFSLEGNLDLQNGKFSTSGIYVNTDTSFNAAFDLEQYGNLILMGNNTSTLGPHISTFSYSDELPLINISSWSHDDVAVNFDCFYDGVSCKPSHSTAAQLRKHRDQLQFNYYSPEIAGFISAFSIDLVTGSLLYSTPNTIFSNTDGSIGSVKILPSDSSTESSIAFYKSSILKSDLPDDFWKISLDKTLDTLSIVHGRDSPSLVFKSDGSISFIKDAIFRQGIEISGSVTIQHDANISQTLSARNLHVTSDVNVSNDGSAAAVIDGGMVIGKSLIVNDQIVSTRLLLSAKKSRIVFNAAEHAPPLLNENSAGTRLILSKNLTPVTTNAAFGTENNGSIWYSIPADLQNYTHTWYAGLTKRMTLDGSGNFSVSGNGSSVRFDGLSNSSGLILSGMDSSDAAYLQFSTDWSLGKTLTGDFELRRLSQNSIAPDSVFKIAKDDLSLSLYNNVIIRGSITTSSTLSCNKVTVQNVHLTSKGISSNGKDIFTFPTSTSNVAIFSPDDAPFDINGHKTSSPITRTSDTHINRNNSGNFTIWRDTQQQFHVNEYGAQLLQGDFKIHTGDLHLSKGNLRVKGEAVVNSLTTDDRIIVGKTTEKSVLYSDPSITLHNEETELSLVVSNGNPSINSSHTITMTANKDMVFNAKGSIQWNSSKTKLQNLSVEGTSSRMSDYVSRITREGKLRIASFEKTIANETDKIAWFYIGRLNTSISSNGTDECGHIESRVQCISLTRDASINASAFAFASQLHFVADVNTTGDLFASHEVISPSEKQQKTESHANFYVYRNEDAKDTYTGDYHVFLKLASNVVAQVSLNNYLTGKFVDIVAEGYDENPNGKYSTFKTGSWKRMYNTKSIAPLTTHSIGSLLCNKRLDVVENATFKGAIDVRNAVTVEGTLSVNKEIYCANLFLQGESSSSLSLSENNLTISKNIVPSKGKQLHIGTEDVPFTSLFAEHAFADKISVKEMNCDTGYMKAVETAMVKSTTVNTEVLRVESDAFFHDVYFDGNLSGNFDLNIVGGGTFNTLTAKTIDVEENCNIYGGMNLYTLSDDNRQSVRITSPKTGSVVVEGNKLTITDDKLSDTVNIATNGYITSSSHLLLCPNDDPLMVLTQSGDVIIHHEELTHRSTSKFSVNSGQSTFKNNVRVGGDLSIDGKLSIAKGVAFSELTSILKVESGLQFKGEKGHSYIFDNNGDILTDGNVVSQGTGWFKTINSDSLNGKSLSIVNSDGQNAIHLSIDKETRGPKFESLNANVAYLFNSPTGSQTVFNSAVTTRDGLSIGKGAENSKGLHIYSDGTGSNSSVTFVNDTSNKAFIKLASSSEDASVQKPYSLTVANDGGDVVVNAAGKRGITIAGVSGNLSCNGAVLIESAVDLYSTGAFDRASAAVTVVGGGAFKGHVLSEKGLILANTEYDTHVKITASTVAQNYTLSLPDELPQNENSILCSDVKGNLFWSPYPVIEQDDNPIQPVVANPTNEVVKILTDDNLTSDNVFGLDSAIVKMGSTVYKPTKRISKMEGTHQWNAIHVATPSLDVTDAYVDESDEYVASTLYIEGAPKSKFAKDTYAIDVKSGQIRFSELHDSVSVNDAAVVIKGGLSVGKVVRCDSEMYTNGLRVGGGTLQKKVVCGKYVIGANNSKCVSVQIVYDEQMPDVDYVITGNVVTAQDDGSMYACSFTALTKEGCKVNVCRINGEDWTNITTAIHYYIVG